jgi:hypothetical protein
MGKVNRVWGLAKGRGSTEEAARGAFTVREYPVNESIPKSDWMNIISIEKDVIPDTGK